MCTTFNSMLQCLTQLIIRQTSIRFQLCQQPHNRSRHNSFSANHPTLRRLRAHALQSHVGAFIVFMCCVPKVCTAITGHCTLQPHELWPVSHISDARSGQGQFSPHCPRLALTSAHPRQCTKQIPTRHKGQIFLCEHFFRCTSFLNIVFMIQHYCTCGVKGVT